MIALAIPRPELGTRAEARTKEVERCLKMGAEYIWMMDLDQTAPDNALAKFATSISPFTMNNPWDILAIDAPSKGYEDSNVRYHPDGTLAYFTISCCLMKASIFDKIAKPWFSSAYDFREEGVKDGKIVWNVQEKAKDNNINEDVYFARKCIEAGLNVVVLPGLKCGHFDLEKI